MTREEAIIQLDYLKDFKTPDQIKALDMAINALTAIDTMQKIVDGDVDTIIAVLKGEDKE